MIWVRSVRSRRVMVGGWRMRVFVSYRRSDSSAWAGRLRDALVVRFGDDGVFQDVATVRPGETFPDATDAAVVQCDVVIVVIGPGWITVAGADGVPRLADPDDFVRREVQGALTHGKVVIPVLVGGAVMPTTDQLPIELRDLAVRNAIALRDETWYVDVDRLISALGGEPPPSRRSHWLLATGLAIGLIAAGTVGWILLDDGPGSDDSGNAGSSSTVLTGVPTTLNAYTATLPTCPTPVPPAWTDLGTDDDATDENPDAYNAWRFRFLGGGYQSDSSDEWDVVIRTQATSLEPATGELGLRHYAFYKLVVGGESFVPYCFQVVSGNKLLGPDESDEALVGFHVTREPAGALAIDIDDFGSSYRIELQPATDS